ncbi:MAG: M56 family metallopeptidase [Pirellulales bacterium]
MFDWLADMALKGLILQVVVLLVAWSGRRSSAARRHLIWFAGVAGLLGLPLLSAVLPAWRVAGWPAWGRDTAQVASGSGTVSADGSSRGDMPRPGVTGDSVWTAPLPGEAESTLPSPARPVTAAPGSASATGAAGVESARGGAAWFHGWHVLVAVWFLGAAATLLPTILGCFQVVRLRRRARLPEWAFWQTELESARAWMGCRRPITLLVSSAVTLPITFGVWRPVLVVPEEAEGWTRERWRMVLLHELAHVGRGDWLIQLITQLACAVHWFNPGVWLSARQLQLLREQACDDLVLAAGVRPSDYAEELLTLARQDVGGRWFSLATVPMARRSTLETRLRAVLDRQRNRAALNARTAAVALVLVGALLVPLAMLQAAGPREVESPRPEESAQGIHVRVLDARGERKLAEFRVVAGVPSGGVAADYERRTGRAVINWQPHTLQVGRDGSYVWPLNKAYEEMALRVEADGYVPQTVTGVRRAAGPRQVEFRLVEDPGVAGRVLRPDGGPAAGATIALAMAQRDAVWEDGRIRGVTEPPPPRPADRWRLPVMRRTNAQGEFVLPSEVEPAAVLIVHESGVRELAYEAWRAATTVTLQPWGRIEGQVLWQDQPGAGEPVSLIVHRDDYGYPGMVASYAQTQCDAEGRFVFERVLPGLCQISRPMRLSATDAPSEGPQFHRPLRHVQVVAGTATPTVLGGRGRVVRGRLTGRDSWQGVVWQLSLRASSFDWRDEMAAKAFEAFRASGPGRLYFRSAQPLNEDGSFTIAGLLPGEYQWTVSVPGESRPLLSRTIRLAPEEPGVKLEPWDLGTMSLTATEPAAVDVPNDAAPQRATNPEKTPAADRASGAEVPSDTAAPDVDAFLARVQATRRGIFGGGPVGRDAAGRVVALGLSEFQLQPGDARLIGQLTHLVRLHLQRSNVGDADLREWRALRQLRELNLWDTKITDAGVAELASLTTLESLRLGGTGITDASLTQLAKLTGLRELDLTRTRVTDAGLPALTPLRQLVALKLADTAISDAGLPVLRQWKTLRGVTLDETGVTVAGLTELSSALTWMQSDLHVAEELAARQSAGDALGVRSLLSVGVDLPTAGQFRTRSLTAQPLTARDTELQRTRYRLVWDWKHEGRDEGLFAEIAVLQRSVRIQEAGLLEAPRPPAAPKPPAAPAAAPPGTPQKPTDPAAPGATADPPAAPPTAAAAPAAPAKVETETVTIQGKAVDAVTGQPVGALIVQGGKFDPAQPAAVTWGFSEGRSSATDGSFSTTVRWAEGWTARVLADGYLPHPVLTQAPPAGKKVVEVVLRLQRGRLVRGSVFDAQGQPVPRATVWALGPTGLNLAGGQAWTTWGEVDRVPQAVLTDAAGKFELPSGDADRLAVSCSLIDAWPAAIAQEGETVVRLPEAARVEVEYDIEGGDPKSTFFLQLLGHLDPQFVRLNCTQVRPLPLGGKLTLAALPPGKYQFCRQLMLRVGELGFGAMLEREFVELKPGQTHTIRYVRPRGARVAGRVVAPAGVVLSGTLVSIESEKEEPDMFAGQNWTMKYASLTAGEDGHFLSERIAPGTYVLSASGYVPLTPEQRVRSGIIQPKYKAQTMIRVPESGQITVPDVTLEPVR